MPPEDFWVNKTPEEISKGMAEVYKALLEPPTTCHANLDTIALGWPKTNNVYLDEKVPEGKIYKVRIDSLDFIYQPFRRDTSYLESLRHSIGWRANSYEQ